MSKIVITGATGFIARTLIPALVQDHEVIALSRQICDERSDYKHIQVDYEDLSGMTLALEGADYVIHLADNPNRQAQDGQQSETAPAVLTKAMRAAGVRRLIFASSIYARKSQEDVDSKYGQHKYQTEQEFLNSDDIDAFILRLPPVYGTGGKGGFSILAKVIARQLPLPVGRAHNSRAYLSCRNLVNLMGHIISCDEDTWNALSGQYFEPSDGRTVSTRELAIMMKQKLHSRSMILPVPVTGLQMLGKLTGKTDVINGIIEGLQPENDPEVISALKWNPIEQMPESLHFLRTS